MHDLLTMIALRQRPPLLVRAARFGVDTYNRRGRLPRLLNRAGAPRIGEAIVLLLDHEADLEERRIARAADYTIAAHVDALTALMGEARLLRASLAGGPSVAPGVAPERKTGATAIPVDGDGVHADRITGSASAASLPFAPERKAAALAHRPALRLVAAG